MKAPKKQNINSLKRKKRKSKLLGFLQLVIICILFPQFVVAQFDYAHWNTFRQTKAFSLRLNTATQLSFQYQFSPQPTEFRTSPSRAASTILSVPSYLEFQELGWFCSFDLSLDKTMKLPLRFRLGNLDEVNRKEGYYD